MKPVQKYPSTNLYPPPLKSSKAHRQKRQRVECQGQCACTVRSEGANKVFQGGKRGFSGGGYPGENGVFRGKRLFRGKHGYSGKIRVYRGNKGIQGETRVFRGKRVLKENRGIQGK